MNELQKQHLLATAIGIHTLLTVANSGNRSIVININININNRYNGLE